MKWSIPEKMVDQGRKYADEGRVVAISQDLDENVWHAEVIGTEVYQVVLDGTPKEEDRCTCSEWPKKGYCKHTVAVEFTLRKKGLNRVLKQNKQLKTTYKAPSLGSQLAKELTQIHESATDSLLAPAQRIAVEYGIESVPTSVHHGNRDVWALTLKVGLTGERLYSVKAIGPFMEELEQEGYHPIVEGQQLHLVESHFEEGDWLILTRLLKLYTSQKITTTLLGSTRSQLKPRFLLLPDAVLLETADFIESHGELKVYINKVKFSHLPVNTHTQPFRFKISPKGEGYCLEVLTTVTKYWSYYQLVLIEGELSQLTPHQIKVFEALIQLLKRTSEQSIDFIGEDVADLFNYVVPQLEEIGTVSVTDAIESELIRQPLKVKLQLSEASADLHCQVTFSYGDYHFVGSEKVPATDYEKQRVVRNSVQEEQVMRLLKKYHYHENQTGFSKPVPTGNELYEFYVKEIPALRKVGLVEISQELQEKYIDGLHDLPKVEVKSNGSWFDVNFDITGIAEAEIDGVILSLLANKPYHQLSDGKLLSLESDDQQGLSQTLKKIRQHLVYDDSQFKVAKHRGLPLAEGLSGYSETTFSEEFQKMTYDLTHPEKLTYPLPSGLATELREYQLVGYRWLRMLNSYGFGGILADDMGLGKTVQAISYLLAERGKDRVGPSLVVAPASLVYNWDSECRKFAPDLKVAVVMGNKNEREALLQEAHSYDMLLVSYASLRQDEALYQQIPLETLILDEAQMVKNATTKTFKAIKSLTTQQRFALSGTPIENKLEELWAIFSIVMPGFFPGKGAFNKLSAGEVGHMIRPFVLRREKQAVLKDLPDKIESNMLSPLTSEQKTTYLAHLRQMQQSVKGMDSKEFKENHLSILAGLTRLRQICCDPRLFIDDYEGGSGKLDQVKELIIAAKANGRRLLLFSQFTGMLEILEKELAELGIDTFYLHGGTKPKNRIEMVNRFNDQEKDVFLISLKAGGTGLNLTGADTVILYDLWWNPAVEEQAASRAHRMGQKKVVEVWRLIAEGTIEEKMFHLQEGKRELFDSVMSDDGKALQKLTEEDIRNILLITE